MRKAVLLGIIGLAVLSAIVIPTYAYLGNYAHYSRSYSWRICRNGFSAPNFDLNSASQNMPQTTGTCNFNFTWAFRREWRGMLWNGFCRGFRGLGIEVSEEFKQNVINIAEKDGDVQKLLDEGYNVTAVMPKIRMVVQENGEVTMKAAEATLILAKDKSGIAFVEVNVEENSVTKITIVNVTVIEKSVPS